MSDKDGNDRKTGTQPGFLPIITNTFDRVFIGAVIFVALHLLWMRFVEAYIPLYVATILSVLIGAVIVARG
jgi:predicted small integral membrane protein